MDLLQSIGKTPLIRLAKLTAGLDAEILVKVESRNPGELQLKDRAALRMIQGALEKGTLKPNGTGTIENRRAETPASAWRSYPHAWGSSLS